MTKLRNKLVLVLLALCIVACLGITVACGGGDEDSSVTYTVTITAGDAGAEGVQVTVKKGSTILGKPQKTNKDGKVEIKLAEAAGYTVTLDNLPEGYELPADAKLEFDAERKLTVALKEQFAYVIKLVNPDGSAYTADDVTVGICTLDDNCLNPVAINANGVAKVYGVEKTDYHVQILGLPAGYAYECDSHGYSVYKNKDGNYVVEGEKDTYNSLSATKTETSVTIYPVEQIKLADKTPLTAEQIAATKLPITGDKAYKFEVKLEAGETAYYSFTPDYDGEYIVCATEAASYKLNDAFLLGDSYITGGGMFNKYGQYLIARAGKTYYLNVTNTNEVVAADGENITEEDKAAAAVTAEFVLTTPAASKVELNNSGTVKAVINKKGANAVVVLAPTAGGTYTLTLKGTGAIKQFAYEYEAENATFADADYKENSSCTVKITADYEGRVRQILYYAVSLKDVGSVNVEVTKKDLKNTIEVVENTALKEYTEKPEGKSLIPVAANATLVKGDDGYYHIGDKNGATVVVVLKKSVGKYTEGIIYSELAGTPQIPYVIDVTSDADKADNTKGNTYKDYRTVLRGFDEYKGASVQGTEGVKLEIPTDILTEKYYAKFVNADGAYPLDDMLKTFLAQAAAEVGTSPLLACYYYGDVTEEDPIVNKYTVLAFNDGMNEESIANGDFEAGEYTLTVNADGTFEILHVTKGGNSNAYDFATACTWKNADGVYTFTVVEGSNETNSDGSYKDLVFAVTFNAETGTISLIGDDDASYWTATSGKVEGGNNDEQKDPVIGEYEFTSPAGNKTLVVNADFTYTIAETMGQLSGRWVKVSNGVYEFTEINEEMGDYTYTVYFTESVGEISFYDLEDDPDNAVYAFTRKGAGDDNGDEQSDPIVGNFATDSMNPNQHALSVSDDGTLVLDDVNGSWEKSEDGTYYVFTLADEDGTKYIAEYDVEGECVVIYTYDASGVVWDNYLYELGVVVGGPGGGRSL